MRLSNVVLLSSTALIFAACSSTPQNPIYQQATKYKSSTPYSDANTAVIPAGYQTTTGQTQIAAPVTYARQQVGTVQNAGYSRIDQECLSKETNRKIIGAVAGGAVGAIAGRKIGGKKKTLGTLAGAAIGGAAGYGIADKAINCDPVYVPVAQQAPIITPAYQPQPTRQAQQNINTASYSATPEYQSSTQSISETTQAPGNAGTPGYYAVQAELPQTNIQSYVPQATQSNSIAANHISTIRHRVITGDTVYSLARTSCTSVSELKELNGINDEFYIRVGEEITIPATRCVK
jgi:LysM repeat protein/outer membrane lipoprotein SlyB